MFNLPILEYKNKLNELRTVLEHQDKNSLEYDISKQEEAIKKLKSSFIFYAKIEKEIINFFKECILKTFQKVRSLNLEIQRQILQLML